MNKTFEELNEENLSLEFLNFVEILTHQILYLRNVYPKEAFTEIYEYNLPFLKYLNDKDVENYINSFLESIEKLLLTNAIKTIGISIINAKEKKVLEQFLINIEIKNTFTFVDHDFICLEFKSILHDFYTKLSNKKCVCDMNKSFILSVETVNEGNIVEGENVYDNMKKKIKSDFIHELMCNDYCLNCSNKASIMDFVSNNYNININHLS